MERIRTRWAAIGAAVAVTLGAGGVGLVDAAKGDGERTAYTAVASCRLVDTRPDWGIGGRTTPLGPKAVHTISARGSSGECQGIPADATAVALNITALRASEATHLTVWPGGDVPNSSSLNPAPGQPPVPNAVSTPLSADGTFDIFNFAGSVHVIVDLVGFYQDHHHDDRYDSKSAIAQMLDGKVDAADVYGKSIVDQALANKASKNDVWTRGQADGRYESKVAAQQSRAYGLGDDAFTTTLQTGATLVASVPVSLSHGGQVVVNYSGTAGGSPGQLVECSVATASSFTYGPGTTAVEFGADQNQAGLAGTRQFNFTSQAQTTIRLVCRRTNTTAANLFDASLTVMVFPS